MGMAFMILGIWRINMGSREDLIRSLAGAYGMSGERKRKESRFDPTTGTLYCGSITEII